MSGQRVAYLRVSTVEQNLDRQYEGLKEYEIEKFFVEKKSGKNITDRPQLRAMLDYVREGDTVYVLEFSRLARSTSDLLNIVDDLNARGIQLVSKKESFDTSTPTGRLLLTMIAAIASFERELTLERQREGIRIAKEKGKYKRELKIQPEAVVPYYEGIVRGTTTKSDVAKALGVSRPTLLKALHAYEASDSGKIVKAQLLKNMAEELAPEE